MSGASLLLDSGWACGARAHGPRSDVGGRPAPCAEIGVAAAGVDEASVTPQLRTLVQRHGYGLSCWVRTWIWASSGSWLQSIAVVAGTGWTIFLRRQPEDLFSRSTAGHQWRPPEGSRTSAHSASRAAATTAKCTLGGALEAAVRRGSTGSTRGAAASPKASWPRRWGTAGICRGSFERWGCVRFPERMEAGTSRRSAARSHRTKKGIGSMARPFAP
jgi:hypothetical protein